MVKQENKLNRRLWKRDDGYWEWIYDEEYIRRLDEIISNDINDICVNNPLFVQSKAVELQTEQDL